MPGGSQDVSAAVTLSRNLPVPPLGLTGSQKKEFFHGQEGFCVTEPLRSVTEQRLWVGGARELDVC